LQRLPNFRFLDSYLKINRQQKGFLFQIREVLGPLPYQSKLKWFWKHCSHCKNIRGGQSSLADFCTYFVAYYDGPCIDINSAREPDRMLGEVRGSNSRCMASSLVENGFVRGSMTQGNGCYQRRCVNNTLEVVVDGIWKVCAEAGGPIQFPGFNGELICPAYHELGSVGPVLKSGQCPNSCNSNGKCVDGKCHCFIGFDGYWEMHNSLEDTLI
ncbi:hypothetical protein M8C21_016858, partial [Ambrosia artemisiifolia]